MNHIKSIKLMSGTRKTLLIGTFFVFFAIIAEIMAIKDVVEIGWQSAATSAIALQLVALMCFAYGIGICLKIWVNRKEFSVFKCDLEHADFTMIKSTCEIVYIDEECEIFVNKDDFAKYSDWQAIHDEYILPDKFNL